VIDHTFEEELDEIAEGDHMHQGSNGGVMSMDDVHNIDIDERC
jgi:hypothetical protein